jgi:hypothetical protein
LSGNPRLQIQSGGSCLTSVADPHHFGKPDPRQSVKLDPDPHQSEKQDPDPHQTENQDLDPHQSEKHDPDPHQRDADPQHCV